MSTPTYYVLAGYSSKWFSNKEDAKLYAYRTGGKLLKKV